MTADTIQITMFILLLLTASCAPSVSVSKYNKKSVSPGYGREDAHYKISYMKLHNFCSICGHKDRNPRDLVLFLRYSNPMVANKLHHIRSARHSAKQQKIDLDEILEEKYLVRRVPFIAPIKHMIKNVNYQIRKYLHGTEPRHNTGLKKNDGRKKTNMISQNQLHIPQEVGSTSSPANRRIRSTVTSEDQLTTPALLLLTHTKNVSHSKTKTQDVNVSTAITLFSKIIVKIPDIVPNRTSNKEIKPTLVPNLLDFYTARTQTVPHHECTPKSDNKEKIPLIQQKIAQAIDEFERKYYATTLSKLSSISPPDRGENGISFVGSGLFLFLILSALSLEVDKETRAEIDSCIALDASDEDKIRIIKLVLNELPPSSDELKFRWSTRLVVNGSWHPTKATEEALRLRLNKLDRNVTTEQLLKKLNHMVEQDSGGAMRNTFEEDELADGVRTVLINTIYMRARWRVAPTLLNETHAFRDADGAPQRTTRMVRINDIMRYADINEWNAQAVEISYATPGLSLLLLVPRGRSLRALSEQVTSTSLNQITNRMRPLRVAISLPIYTLRMTLLLPNKLQAMGISRLVDLTNGTDGQDLRLSHAVQRLMFWAEAGRNAFKDDGIEWDDRPDMEMMVDRPYIFSVRWRNLTLLNGNFVL